MNFILTAGNINDSTQAIELLRDIIREGMRILGDKAFDSDAILEYIISKGAIPVIPPKKNRVNPQDYDKEAYKNRNQIERFFNRLKNFRRISTRYDKLPSSFLSFVYLGSALMKLPKYPKIAKSA